MKILIDTHGKARAIYSDALAPIMRAVGKPRTERVSDVEPLRDGRWEADLSRVLGPILGPYSTRQEALDAEVAWLLANDLPVARP